MTSQGKVVLQGKVIEVRGYNVTVEVKTLRRAEGFSGHVKIPQNLKFVNSEHFAEGDRVTVTVELSEPKSAGPDK